MNPEAAKELKNFLVKEIIDLAYWERCEFTILPCHSCPIYKYWETHDWVDKKEVFCCTDVVKFKEQRDDIVAWMNEQW